MAILKVEADKEEVEKIHRSYKDVISIDLDKGELLYKDLPIIFARAELLYNLSEEMKKIIGESAHGLMYRIGRPYGLTFYELVEKISPGPYLEMFARTARPGWEIWGLESPINQLLLDV